MTLRPLLTSILIGAIAASPLQATKTAGNDTAGRPRPAATILCYHIVESPQDDRMYVSRETFRQQMRYLTMTGYNVIPLRHLFEYVTGKRDSIPNNAVVITIDDGWRSTYTEVFPEMQKRNFPFTVFIYPKIIGMTPLALTWKQVREMAEAGVDIQSHTLSHAYLTRKRHASLDDEEYSAWLRRELLESKRILENETGRKVEFLAYPYGDFDGRVASGVANAGYSAALTCEYGRVMRGSDPLRMKRVVIDKRMDFASFRRYLGAGRMELEAMSPPPGETFEPEQPLVISARIRSHDAIDPKSVGIALLGSGRTIPYSYDARDGSISIVVRDAQQALEGTQRAIVWATERGSGRRVEASWTFRIPDANALRESSPTVASAGGGGRAASLMRTAVDSHSLQRAPR
ncbi:MAG TPA: polysaccharide deacetylase family protein [Thermoanaerobaculia bacterium]|nr:polysaccharide deacetylase family protein [Thermoanaerobaculia bacterium]